MRPLSPNSAIIANDLVDNGLAGSDSPDQAIADTVNWRRTQHGQDALAQLAEMAPAPWRRRVLPADPTPYRIQEIQQHRLNRTSMSMQSVPPALSLSGELAFDPMQFLDIPDTPSSTPSAPALQEVANRSELWVPLGESVDSAAIAPPPPSIKLFPWRWTLSRPFRFIVSQFVNARDSHAGSRQHGQGTDRCRSSLTGSRLEHAWANSQIHAVQSREGARPGNGEIRVKTRAGPA